MSGSARAAALGASLVAAAVGVLAGAALHASNRADLATATVATPAVEASVARAETAAPDTRLAAADAVITGAMGVLGAGSLGGEVLVVGLGEAAAPGAGTVAADLRAAGAVVDPPTVLLDGWIDTSLGPLRSGLADQLAPAGSTGLDDLTDVLARSLAEGGSGAATALAALAGAELVLAPAAPPTPTATSSTPATTAEPSQPAPEDGDAVPARVVFVSTWGADDGVSDWIDVMSTWQAAVPTMAVFVAEYDTPLTVAGDDAEDTQRSSLVAAVRRGPSASRVSTIDHADSGLGRVSVIRSVARTPPGPVGHYGFLRGPGVAVVPVPGMDGTAGTGG